jgi:hypothetical protein
MKIKYIFEPEDFNGAGQCVIRQSSPKGGDISFASSVAYKVGYIFKHRDQPKCTLLISLTDGMSMAFANDQALCDHLNNDPEGYRVMTDKEITAVCDYVGNRFLIQRKKKGK